MSLLTRLSHSIRFSIFAQLSALAVILSMILFSAHALAAPVDPTMGRAGPYQINLGINPAKCVDIEGWSTSNGGRVQIYDCLGVTQTNQLYTLNPVVGSYGVGYQLISKYSGLCLDVTGYGTADGTPLQQYACLGANQLNQIWQFVQFGNSYQIQSVLSGKCMDLAGGSQTNTNTIDIWDCWSDGSNTNQIWDLTSEAPLFNPTYGAPGPYQANLAINHDKCIDIRGPSTADGAVAQIYDCLGASQTNQLYNLVPVSGPNYGQGYQIVSAYSGKCLEVTGAGTADGTPLQQNGCLGTSQLNQIWQFVPFGGAYNFQIRSAATGKCIDLSGGNQTNTNTLEIWDCAADGSNTNQLWTGTPVSSLQNGTQPVDPTGGKDGSYEITLTVNSDKCIDIQGPTANENARAQIYDCLGANQANQIYYPVPISESSGPGFELVSKYSGECLDVSGAGTADGTPLVQASCGETPQSNQVWQFFQYGSNYQIRSLATGKCIDLSGGSQTNTNTIQIWDCGADGSNTNQLWNLDSMPVTPAPADAREITLPGSMSGWGFVDVTQGGASLVTASTPSGCPDALPNQSDAASVTQTTQAIQCRLNLLGSGSIPFNLYFPSGTYYINQTLSLKVGYWSGSTFVVYANGARGNWQPYHIMGQDPATTKIVWAGSCGTDPNIAKPASVTKYNDIFYVGGISPLLIERLTLDGGQETNGTYGCAGDGIDLVSEWNPHGGGGSMSPITINEMVLQNFREVGIVGGRAALTNEEIQDGGIGAGMVSEVSVTNVQFHHMGYAGLMTGAANALDYWIRDSLFDDCGYGVTNLPYGEVNGNYIPGLPPEDSLPWGTTSYGGFNVANSIFTNSRISDVQATGNHTALRNNYSTGSKGPFITCLYDGSSPCQFYLQGNTVISPNAQIPVVAPGPQNFVTMIGNKFFTSPGVSAVLDWTDQYNDEAQFIGASPVMLGIYANSYSSLVSIGNQYSSADPFSAGSEYGFRFAPAASLYTVSDAPGFASNGNLLQCGESSLASPRDNRTYCAVANNGEGTFNNDVYNLLTFDDQTGVTSAPPAEPTLPPVRPIVNRLSVMVSFGGGNDLAGGTANSQALQAAVNSIVSQQAACSASDYYCPARMGVVFLPPGLNHFAVPIDIPAGASIQIVGTYTTELMLGYAQNNVEEPTTQISLFRIHAPSHVVMRDFTINTPTTETVGISAEVADLSSSRVVAEKLLTSPMIVQSIGNVPFEMRESSPSATTIIGNGKASTGYVAFFGGNPADFTLGGDASTIIEDTWIEGSTANLLSCQNDSGRFTFESSHLTQDEYRSGPENPSQAQALNFSSCAMQGTVIASDLYREGYTDPNSLQALNFPAGSNPQAQALLLQNNSTDSNYGAVGAVVPENYAGTLDQGYFSADPSTQAQYANALGTFEQSFAENPTLNWEGPTANFSYFGAQNTGNLSASFIGSMLSQARDPRFTSASVLIPPITDPNSSDIQLYRVTINSAGTGIQFVLPGTSP